MDAQCLNVRLPYTYWLRSVTYSGVYSVWCPPDAQGGYVVPACMDVSMEEVMDDLTGSISENELVTSLNDRIDLIDSNTVYFEPGVFDDGVITSMVYHISDIGAASNAHEVAIAALDSSSSSLSNTIDGLQQEVATLTTNIFDVNTYYQEGAYSNYAGVLYRCIEDVTVVPTPTPDMDPVHWEEAPDTVELYTTISERVDDVEGELETKVEQATYDQLEATVEEHGTSITQNASNILLKASQAEVDLLDDTVTSHTSSIDQNADGITLTATAIVGPIAFAEDVAENGVCVQSVEDIENIDGRVSQVALDLDAVDARITASVADVSANLDTATNTLTQSIADASLSISASDGVIAEHTEQIATINTTTGEQASRIDSALLRISASEGIALQHTSQIDDAELDIDNLQADMAAAVLRIDAEEGISAIHTQTLDSQGASIATLQTDVAQAQIDISANEGVLISHTQTLDTHGEDILNLDDAVEANGASIAVNAGGISLIGQSVVGTVALLEEVAEEGVVVRSVSDVTPIDTHISQVALDLDTSNATITAQVADLETELDAQASTLTQSLASASAEISAHDGILAQHATSIETLDQTTGDIESRLDVVSFQMTSEAGIVAQHSREIETAQGDIVSQAAEMALASDRFSITIQKDENGTYYAAGFGLIVYPQWRTGGVYESGKCVWHEGASYSSKIDGNTGHEPDGEDAYWAVVDDDEAPESEFVIQADKLMVLTPGETEQAVLALGTVNGVSTMALNGNLVADNMVVNRMLSAGCVTADTVSATDVFHDEVTCRQPFYCPRRPEYCRRGYKRFRYLLHRHDRD